MELMMNMQVSYPVTAVHMTVQESTNVFKILEIFFTYSHTVFVKWARAILKLGKHQ